MDSKQVSKRVLLLADVKPSKYVLEFDVDVERHRFHGNETIHCRVCTSTDRITLHSRDLHIRAVEFAANGESKRIRCTNLHFDTARTTVTFVFPQTLPVGDGLLCISFVGELNNQLAGFYRSTYTNSAGEKRTMANTQFAALDARRCFPCWDEPAVKAVFEISVLVDPHLSVLSNMPETTSTTTAHASTKSHKKRTSFAPTPRMSTYLVALCVGEFDCVQARTKGGVVVRVFSLPGRAPHGLFSLRVACDVLDFYDEFFQIKYPLPKLDMVAVPEFQFGAMENWGLVLYREVDLLIDETAASSAQRQRVSTIVCHELSHQWFGNLVTMRWWDDLWLNEGFACWMQTFATDKLFPDWRMWEQFCIDDQASAMKLDALKTSHPIQVPIAHAEEVEGVFDAISYSKGACVVRMVYAVLGQELFQKGLQMYMQQHAYNNTETVDLWAAWEKVSALPISEMMKSWTEQVGFPMLRVHSLRKSNNTTLELELEQTWFIADSDTTPTNQNAPTIESEKCWVIPVITATTTNQNTQVQVTAQPHFMRLKKETVSITVPQDFDPSTDATKLNFGQTSMIRVLYPTSLLLGPIATAIRTKAFPEEDRAAILADTFALARAGLLDMETVPKLLDAFVSEDTYTAWAGIESVLGSLFDAASSGPVVPGVANTAPSAFCRFAVRLAKPLFDQLGWDPTPNDGHLTRLLRATVARIVCHFSQDRLPEDKPTITEAKRRMDRMLDPSTPVSSSDAEFRVPVMCIALRSGSADSYHLARRLFDSTSDVLLKRHIMNSCGQTPFADLKRQTMEWALKDVPLQDCYLPMLSVSGSGAEGSEIAWKFFVENLPQFRERLDGSFPKVTDLVLSACSRKFRTREGAAELQEFFDNNPFPGSQRTISQILERINIGIAFRERMCSTRLVTAEFWDELGRRE